MAVNETIITGRMYRVWDKANSIWKRFSYWTKASDVEMNDGTTVENTVSQLKTNITKLSSDTPWYGTCSTGASTATKVATTTDSKFALVTGAKVRIKFTYTNTATTPTLNVDSKGAKTIYGYGTTKPNSWWKAGDTVEFIYDGNYWIMSPSQGQIYQINNELTELNNDLTKKELVNTYYDSSVNKLYQVNADGTKGSEIDMSPIKRVLRGKKTIGNTTYTAPVTIAIPLGVTVVPSKCHVTLYGNTNTSGSYDANCGFYVDTLTSSTLTLGFALNNLVPHPNSVIGWEIVEYN